MVILGWNAASEQYDTFDMLDQAVAAEKVGFESILQAITSIPGTLRDSRAISGHGWAQLPQG
jgi:hypothetical protein